MKELTKSMKEIKMGEGAILVSYQTPVAFKDQSGRLYKTMQHWSATTTRHINRWLRGAAALPMPQDWFYALYKEAENA